MLQAVIEHGSFAKAAEAIHKSQSSINTAVHKLQSSLGVELLRVEGRRTVLTDTGKLMLRRGNLLLDEVRRMEDTAAELAKGTEATLKIAVDSIYPSDCLFNAFDNLSRQFPYVRVELIETILSGSNELLLAGEVPVAISPSVPNGMLPEPVCDIEFQAVAAHDHPLTATNSAVSYQTLKEHRQIVTRDSALGKKTDSGWLEAEQRWTVTNMTTSIDLVSRGYGYAWLPYNKIQTQLQQGTLQLIQLDKGQTRKVTLFLVIADEDKLGPAARSLVSIIRGYAQQFSTAPSASLTITS